MKNLWYRLCRSTIGAFFLCMVVPYLLLFWLEYREKGRLSPRYLCTYGILFAFYSLLFFLSYPSQAPSSQSKPPRFRFRWQQPWGLRFFCAAFFLMLPMFLLPAWVEGRLDWSSFSTPLLQAAFLALLMRRRS